MKYEWVDPIGLKLHLPGNLSSQSLMGLAVALLLGLVLAFGSLTAVVGLAMGVFVVLFGLLALRQPLWALGATLVLAPLGAWEAQHPILAVLPLPLGQLAWVGTCVVWAFHWLGRRERSVPRFGVQRPLVLFLFVGLLSLLTTESMSLGAKEVIKWLEILLIVWLVLDVRPYVDERLILLLLGMLGLPALIQGGLGIAQFVQVDGPDSFLILDRFYRAYGTFQQPNPFGGFMALNGLLGLGIAVGLGWDGLWERLTGNGRGAGFSGLEWVILLGGGVLTAVAVVALIASWSRGAWLGFVAGGAALVLFWSRKRDWGISLILCGALQIGRVPV